MRGYLALIVSMIILGACSGLSVPASSLPYTTDFADAGQWTQTSNRQADLYIQEGQLHIMIKQPDTLAWSAAGLALSDFTFEVDAAPLEGPDDNGYGLVVRRVDDDNFYSLQISGDGYFIVQKRAKGQWINLTGDWQAGPAIHLGQQANHLRVTCQGNRLTFFVNDEQLTQVTDGEFARGDIGVIASTFAEHGVHVAFDNVAVKRNE